MIEAILWILLCIAFYIVGKKQGYNDGVYESSYFPNEGEKMKIKKLYEDKAGNKLQVENGKVAGRNRQNRLISQAEMGKFIRRKEARKALEKEFGKIRIKWE